MSSATYLFVPGDRRDRFAKAVASGADHVIADLEDSVAADRKAAARAAVRAALKEGQGLLVRINGRDTPDFEPDLQALDGLSPDGIVVPKVEDAEVIDLVSARFPAFPILPIIETARGLANVHSIASATGVKRLVFGTLDFRLDLGITGEGIELLYFRSQLVLASRLAGIDRPVDGPASAIDDPGLADDAEHARRLGFGGKLCIHPRQVEVVARAFLPSETEWRRAREIVQAAEKAAGGVTLLEGQMIDKPVVEMARQLLARERGPQKIGR